MQNVFVVEQKKWKVSKPKVIIAILCSVYFLKCLFDGSNWHFIDGANLTIHEVGHVIFIPFGHFVYVLGGSLFQIMAPLFMVLYFYRTAQRYSGALTLFWVGESIVNVSIYARDAVARQLPLITGDIDSHDWHYLLSGLGWLQHTQLIANIILSIGFGVVLFAIIFSFYEAGVCRDGPRKSF